MKSLFKKMHLKTMDLSLLPDDVLHHIKSFLIIVSWRSEHHYFKLLQRYRNITFDHVPYHLKSTCIEYNTYYMYHTDYYYESSFYYLYAFKDKIYDIETMKNYYVRKYTAPLLEYLTRYRERIIYHSWNLTTTFWIFGIYVHGNINSSMYINLLLNQALIEGLCNDFYTWQGCIPLDEYKKACTIHRLSTILNS